MTVSLSLNGHLFVHISGVTNAYSLSKTLSESLQVAKIVCHLYLEYVFAGMPEQAKNTFLLYGVCTTCILLYLNFF